MVAADGTADPAHALLVISGEDEAATKLAAITFSNISFRFPGSDELKAFDFSLPDVAQYSGRETIATDTDLLAEDAQLPDAELGGTQPGERSITFRLPPDFHIRPNQHAKLMMNFSYGVGLKNDSSFNVSVNGRGVRAVRLDSPTAPFIENYELSIPTYVFQPGSNTITFAAHLNSGGQVCDLLQPDGLFFTLYENSSISFPPMPHFVELPEARALHALGLPDHALARRPRGVRVARRQGRPHARRRPQHGGLATQRNATRSSASPILRQPEKRRDPGGGPRTTIDARSARGAAQAARGRGRTCLSGGARLETEQALGDSRQQSALGRGGLLMQFQSPYQPGAAS
jgi:hypothetical protein